MIITCPTCESEYDILETALGEAGREVKCAKCSNKWFAKPDGTNEPIAEVIEEDIEEPVEQETASIEPETQEIKEEAGPETNSEIEPETDQPEAPEDQEDEIDIPDSVKPINADDAISPITPPSLSSKMAGYGAALLIFGLLIGYIFVNKNKIIGKWLPAAAFYEMAGVPAKLKGEGLIVESLSATVLKNKQQQDVLVVKGRVVNLTDAVIDVPKMEANMRTTNGEGAETWIIDPPVESIGAGEAFSFTTDYPNVPKEIGSVNLAFIPTLEK